jgi:cytochrome c5
LIKPVISLVALLGATVGQAEPLASPAGLDGFVTVDRLPDPDVPLLAFGRSVWGETCQNCHGGNKLTGAPKITSTDAWAHRIEQGMAALVAHAIEGFMGASYAQMPARGGNPDLSDAAVSAAVAFMVWSSGGAEQAEAFLKETQSGKTTHE